jgi:hypothetical protein
MTAAVRPLLSGGAFLEVNGVERWFPSARLAEDERKALTTPVTTVDYPTALPSRTKTAEVNA